MHRFAIAAFVLALAVVLATGCSTLPPVRFYVVTPLAGAAPAARAPGPGIVVATVRLPGYLERPQLVTRSGDNRLQLEEFHEWGENLAGNLTRVMAENLFLLLGSDTVVAAPNTLRLRPDYRVNIEVLRFERAGDTRVHLTARWWLQRGADLSTLTGATTTLVSEPLPEATGTELTVGAMSRVYGDLSRVIAQAVPRLEKAAR